MFKYFPHTDADKKTMLEKCGMRTMKDLFSEVPEELLFKTDFDIPSAMSELEIRSFFEELGKQNQTLKVFAGAGAYDHYSPAVINTLISRSEFLTAYTPYQPEISQGTLQYIFEYQSMISELNGMECTNASMYDGMTAAAEAMLMSVAATKKKNKVLVSSTMHPQAIRIIETYAKYKGFIVELIAASKGVTDKEDLATKLEAKDIAGVLLPSLNFYGIIENLEGVAELVHSVKALFVVYADPSSLAVLKTPAEWGADIACGDGQTLGIPLQYGGSYVGYLSATKKLMRKLPGRIVGATKDVDGKRAFVLTLQAREQHIRREKANSNICSNQSLMALYVTIYMALMGKEGLKEVNELSYSGAHYLYNELLKTGFFAPVFDQPFLKEFVLKSTKDVKAINQKLLETGFMGGVELEQFNAEMKDCLLFCVTEKRSKSEIDQFVQIIKEA